MDVLLPLKLLAQVALAYGLTSLVIPPASITPVVGTKTPITTLRLALRGIPSGSSVSKPIATTENRPAGNVALANCQRSPAANRKTNFLVFAGGGSPEGNEIALEKNVLYFQRTLRTLGYDPVGASVFFANGTDGQASIRYIDPTSQQEQYKAPEIPNLLGASTPGNLQGAMQQLAQRKVPSLFFYFTGHGAKNRNNLDNNAMILWGNQLVSVQQFARLANQFPPQTPVVTMMAQCYSGSFANFIYENGDPKRPVAMHSRCGFFATIKELPSVGCTPEVNEADYRDYSSSFFAGLSGRSRVGAAVPSTDFNRDGRIAYREAHAYAKIDDHSMDLPISTSEAWLQNQLTDKDETAILSQPINQWLKVARPEQKYVINSMVQMFGLDPRQSYNRNVKAIPKASYDTEPKEAYLIRLGMELYNIGMEQKIRKSGNRQRIATLDRLLRCEAGSWN